MLVGRVRLWAQRVVSLTLWLLSALGGELSLKAPPTDRAREHVLVFT
jgi:hypothetical protein